MPASSPPPPSGAITASTSGRSSTISSPMVPLPEMKSIVVERMDEPAAHAIRPVLFDRAPAFIVRHLDDGGAEPLDGAQLRRGSGVHHHDAAGRAGQARGERDPLRGVSGADRPDAVRELLPAEVADGVLRSADLEGADRLERLQLEKNLGTGVRVPGSSRRTSGVRMAARYTVSAASRMVSREMRLVVARFRSRSTDGDRSRPFRARQ